MATADIEGPLLQQLDRDGAIADSGDFAAANGWEHNAVVGVIKSLEAAEMVVTQDISHSKHVVRPDAEAYATAGSPEAQVFAAVPPEGVTLAALKAALPGDVADLGFRQAMQQKWVATDKSSGEPRVVRKVESIVDTVQQQLQTLLSGGDLPAADLEALTKKRKMLQLNSWKTFSLSKGPKFALQRKRQATELTAEMIAKGTWRDQEFKDYNFNALGLPPNGGALHPLLKVRTQYRKIFTLMGFEEMPTNNYVESSFWNFDALFQPQQHPARDAHDTFFTTRPATTDTFPEDYLARVKSVHEHGGYGSAGYGYCWKRLAIITPSTIMCPALPTSWSPPLLPL
ncbi:phenylalanyl-tRNA synthetase alphachain [Monoraphidium neglectum]|uniref:Phenylalanyl-tRNA synthetase alphachain n=1 Tax=Monoraphidium neglectum TaxID=145388 RepID=A0A0D2MVQ3_9CHLO|nr:phenylalanyl-tRNA synthetase alphachain [Monoraphidium neglectum]KIY98410.1 phenylalanyl-tRNA synthetase alphachain [Monoraphidium neglectum]|eukprot:XP_013897430.1 phenylalanyl-tRNA synthetase alphachain [Monoraphidium neglectum]